MTHKAQDHAYGIDRGTPEDDGHLVEGLADVLDSLSMKDKEFAASLVNNYRDRGRLSPKQWHWVDKLTRVAVDGYPEPARENVGNFGGVIALMGRAVKNLKHPRIRLHDSLGREVALSIAGAKAKEPGTVNVTDGQPYGQNIWYGRVNKDGTWTRSRSADDVIGEVLARLAQDPEGIAAAHGKLTGRCCFCSRNLDDKRSTEVGYGQTCAKNFGLPWGMGS